MIKMFGTVVLVLLSLSAAAHDKECEGTFNVDFKSNKVEFRKKGTISAWIPATVRVTGSLRQCAKVLSLKPTRSNQIILRGPGHNLQGQLFDNGYHALQSVHGDRYLLPLDSTGITRFWMRLPSAGFAPAGHYNGRLHASIHNHQSIPMRSVDVDYRAKPVVAMHVPTVSKPWLTKSGNNYRVDMGEMTKGAKRNIILSMRSNASVSVSVESKNGKLMHEKLKGESIDYRLTLQGQNWDPRRSFHTVLGPMQSNRFTRVPFSIEVKPQPRAFAGHYSDRLTITVSAK